MTRKTTLTLWAGSILYFVALSTITQLLVWYAPGRISNPDRLVIFLLVSPFIVTLWTSFVIFYSVLAWPLLAASPKSWLDKQGGGLLYNLLWRELRDKVDDAPSR
ncbi:MAG: hypothetical protein EOR84_06450 [Mesorhizobium sp.]|uniref:hypothetical protein n=1 Tax=Mesorhizobium sp. TaxID=1871066 RepID=UPI000FE47ECF|nr:hypothetical protein [Mesorhizobium sp.]RWN01713.1 MAG: hypothetical protein EOR84_06450 [Mesorhizobium sp.]